MALASNLGARPYNQRYSAHSCLCSCYTWSSPWRTCQISVISQFRAKFLTISSLRCGHNSSVNNGEGFPWSQFCRWTSLYRRTWIIVVHQCSSMFLNVPLCSSLPDCRLVSATNVITKVTDFYHSLAQVQGCLEPTFIVDRHVSSSRAIPRVNAKLFGSHGYPNRCSRCQAVIGLRSSIPY